MRFGLFHSIPWPEGTDQRQRYREAFEQALKAEEIGFESVWLTEHHFSRHAIVPDTLNVLSHLAARTKRVRLGTAVSVVPFHNPVRLAESAATVDLLSDGRLDIGLGSGYMWSEFHGFNLPLDERHVRFNEAVDLMLRSWSATEPFHHEGRYWKFNDINPQPKPVQQPHPPLWFAVNSEFGIRMCVERDWGVMLAQGTPLSRVAEQVATYRKALQEAGKPFDPERLILARSLYVARDDAAAWADADGPYLEFLRRAASLSSPPSGNGATNPFGEAKVQREAVLFGGPETVMGMLRQFAAMGIERLIFFVNMGGLRQEQIIQSLDRFAREVMPQAAALRSDRGR